MPAKYLEEITGGLWHDPVSVETNRRMMDEDYDLILSIGQFVRHEYFRRILCDKLGGLVEQGEYPCDMDTLGKLVEDICRRNARDYSGLDIATI